MQELQVMSDKKQEIGREGIDRRTFFKVAAAASVAASGVTGGAAEALEPERRKSVSAATFGIMKQHDSIDDIYEISPDYQRFDQINLLFSNVSPYNSRTNDPNDPDYDERQRIRQSFGMYVAKADGVVDILRAAREQGKEFDEFMEDLGQHSIPFPPPVAKMLWDDVNLQKLFSRSGEMGWSQREYAFENAGWAVDHFGARLSEGGVCGHFTNFVDGEMRRGLFDWNRPAWPTTYMFKSADEATRTVKKASFFLGADVVGIAPYDVRWVWERRFNLYDGTHEKNTLPFEPKSVVVFGFEMDYNAYKTTPSAIGDGAAGFCYTKMAVTGHSLAEFIRKLGYNAIACGNDTASSVPLGIQAGLGESSRMGTMISPFYGPRIRLSKVYTDLELITDTPITFGVKEFCGFCKKCAEACPSKAISFDDEPSFEVKSCVSNPGVKKWYLKADLCVQFWGEAGTDCGHCITACPYNKMDLWHHRLARTATYFPGTRRLAKYLDDAFGYGKRYGTPAHREIVETYWDRE